MPKIEEYTNEIKRRLKENMTEKPQDVEILENEEEDQKWHSQEKNIDDGDII